jgi:glycerol-3-phosphate acyltransferase PlsY
MDIYLPIAYPILAAVVAYLIGSLSFAVLVSRAMGLADPRSYGSQNPGATNVLRSGNKAAAALTLLLDGVKGWLPVWAVVHYGPQAGMSDGTLALVALAAFVGHVWPVFFRFKGGKGVATAAGVLFGIEPFLGLATMSTWLIVAFFTRYSSLAALSAAVFAPVYYGLGHRIAWQASEAELFAIVIMSAILLWRHQDNIVRLVRGQEARIGAKKDAS